MNALKTVRLILIRPSITKEFSRFNKIPGLNLDLSLDPLTINVSRLPILAELKVPVVVRLEEVPTCRMMDPEFMRNLFSSVINVKKLT